MLPESELKWNTVQLQIVNNEHNFIKAHTSIDAGKKPNKLSLLFEWMVHSCDLM